MWYDLARFGMSLLNNEWFLETNFKNECESNIYITLDIIEFLSMIFQWNEV